MLEVRKKRRIGDILIDAGVVTEEQIQAALRQKAESDKKIGEILVELAYTNEFEIAKAISQQLGFEMVSLDAVEIDEAVLKLADVSLLRKYVMIPLDFLPGNPNVVRLAMADPMDMMGIDDFSIVTNLQVAPVISTTTEVMLALDRHFGDSESMKAVQEFAKERKELQAQKEDEDNNEGINNSPIVLLVNNTLEQAARQRASDIHIEAMENKVRVRYRIDGTLYEKATYDIQILPAIIARLKVIGGMDLGEKRKPQDGRISVTVDHKEYDIRVSILPTVHGEKCVMRLAQKKALTRDKRELGFEVNELEKFDRMLSNPNGILIVTGPTGSGKSTTLYTALSELNREDVNIVTVEDPVEANIDGVNQVQVNVKAGLSFASALRSILRQDPDIVMIGEIRDEETAGIAVQASITGHLVVSTLHTNSAAATVSRLLNMGVESYLLADSLIGIIAQRLVRRLCPDCKKAKKPDVAERRILSLDDYDDVTIFEPVGCPMCANTGYRGRIGIYEMMEVTPEIKELIVNKDSTAELKEVAMSQGMVTLKNGARKKVLDGITSISEMMDVSAEE